MKSIAMRVHLSPQRIGHWSSEKCLLHGNVLFHVIGYPYLKKRIVILEKDVPYNK
jgi:hypothetical protein